MKFPSSVWSSGYGEGWLSACKLLGIDMRVRERQVAKKERKAGK